MAHRTAPDAFVKFIWGGERVVEGAGVVLCPRVCMICVFFATETCATYIPPLKTSFPQVGA